jgi:hypothetical protein
LIGKETASRFLLSLGGVHFPYKNEIFIANIEEKNLLSSLK